VNCKKAKKYIILGLYEELAEGEKAELGDHLRRCPSCERELSLTKKIFTLLDQFQPAEGPETDRDRSWSDIRSRLLSAPAKPRTSATGLRWALAGTSAAIVLVAAFFIGKFGRAPVSGRTWPAALSGSLSPDATGPAFSAHLDDVKPILLDYAHFTPGEKTGREIAVDEDALRGLILQNVLLKRRLIGKDPAAAEFLDDVELVLREITNRGTDSPQSPAQIRDLIERRDILFKMEILRKF